jgi:hypothetical protein
MAPRPARIALASLAPADASWRERVGREIAGLFIDWGELRLIGSVLFTVMFGAIQGSTLDHGFSNACRLIFVVPGPAQDNRPRREGDICLVATVNLTP